MSPGGTVPKKKEQGISFPIENTAATPIGIARVLPVIPNPDKSASPGDYTYPDEQGLTKAEFVTTQLVSTLFAKKGKLTAKDIAQAKKYALQILG